MMHRSNVSNRGELVSHLFLTSCCVRAPHMSQTVVPAGDCEGAPLVSRRSHVVGGQPCHAAPLTFCKAWPTSHISASRCAWLHVGTPPRWSQARGRMADDDKFAVSRSLLAACAPVRRRSTRVSIREMHACVGNMPRGLCSRAAAAAAAAAAQSLLLGESVCTSKRCRRGSVSPPPRRLQVVLLFGDF